MNYSIVGSLAALGVVASWNTALGATIDDCKLGAGTTGQRLATVEVVKQCAANGKIVDAERALAYPDDQVDWAAVGRATGTVVKLRSDLPQERIVLDEFASRTANRYSMDALCERFSVVLARTKQRCEFPRFSNFTVADAITFLFRGDPRDYNVLLMEASLEISGSRFNELAFDDREYKIVRGFKLASSTVHRLIFAKMIVLGDLEIDQSTIDDYFNLENVYVIGNLTLRSNKIGFFTIAKCYVLGRTTVDQNEMSETWIHDSLFAHFASPAENKWGVDKERLQYMLQNVTGEHE